MRSELLKGHLDLLLLAVLQEGPSHGYAIIEELARRSGGEFNLPEGTIYPALHRLERSRLLSSHWQPVSGRRRRVYAVTAKGKNALSNQEQEWRAFHRVVGAVLGEAGA
jgi:PadR family transcriptional regulator